MTTDEHIGIRRRYFVPLGKLILVAELVIMVFGLLAASRDPLAGFDPPPPEKQSHDDDITNVLVGFGLLANALAGFRALDGKRPMDTYVALRRVVTASVLAAHVMLAVFLVQMSLTIGAVVAVVVLVVLAVAFSASWSSSPTTEDVPSTFRRRSAAGLAAAIAVALLASMATFTKSSYAGMDVSIDIRSMNDGRVVAMVRHFDDKSRKVIIADPTKVIWSKNAAEHQSIAGGVPLPVSPSGKVTAYEDIDASGSRVYIVVNSDGVEVGRISGINGTSHVVFANDHVVLHPRSGPKKKRL